MANVHHHLAVLVPKTFHTPRTVNYWNEIAKERSTLPPIASGCTLWLHFSRAYSSATLFKAQSVEDTR